MEINILIKECLINKRERKFIISTKLQNLLTFLNIQLYHTYRCKSVIFFFSNFLSTRACLSSRCSRIFRRALGSFFFTTTGALTALYSLVSISPVGSAAVWWHKNCIETNIFFFKYISNRKYNQNIYLAHHRSQWSPSAYWHHVRPVWLYRTSPSSLVSNGLLCE